MRCRGYTSELSSRVAEQRARRGRPSLPPAPAAGSQSERVRTEAHGYSEWCGDDVVEDRKHHTRLDVGDTFAKALPGPPGSVEEARRNQCPAAMWSAFAIGR